MLQQLGRSYSKTIIWQGDVQSTPLPQPQTVVQSAGPGLPWRSLALTRIGDPNSAPIVVSTAVPSPLAVSPVQPLPWRSLALTRIGDPNSAPIVTTTTTTPPVVAVPARPLPWRSFTATRIGDPTSTPAAIPATTAPVLVSPLAQIPVRSMVLLAASAADISFTGPVVSTPIPQVPRIPAALIVRQLQDGAVVNQGAPVPTTIVTPVAPTVPRRPPVIQWIGDPNSTPSNVGGPVPFSLIVTNTVGLRGVPEIITVMQTADGAQPPVDPVIVSIPRLAGLLPEIITLTPPAPVVAGTVAPAPLVLIPMVQSGKRTTITVRQPDGGPVNATPGPVPVCVIVTNARRNTPGRLTVARIVTSTTVAFVPMRSGNVTPKARMGLVQPATRQGEV